MLCQDESCEPSPSSSSSADGNSIGNVKALASFFQSEALKDSTCSKAASAAISHKSTTAGYANNSIHTKCTTNIAATHPGQRGSPLEPTSSSATYSNQLSSLTKAMCNSAMNNSRPAEDSEPQSCGNNNEHIHMTSDKELAQLVPPQPKPRISLLRKKWFSELDVETHGQLSNLLTRIQEERGGIQNMTTFSPPHLNKTPSCDFDSSPEIYNEIEGEEPIYEELPSRPPSSCHNNDNDDGNAYGSKE